MVSFVVRSGGVLRERGQVHLLDILGSGAGAWLVIKKASGAGQGGGGGGCVISSSRIWCE
jgi:hypothetical protein